MQYDVFHVQLIRPLAQNVVRTNLVDENTSRNHDVTEKAAIRCEDSPMFVDCAC
jgi:hypothetical protein